MEEGARKGKEYRLKRDLPMFKAGETGFYLDEYGNLMLMVMSASTIANNSGSLEDWFEEVKAPGVFWKPKVGQRYYYIDSTSTTDSAIWDGDSIDDRRFRIGNVFGTKDAAKEGADWLEAVRILREDTGDYIPKGGQGIFWYVNYDVFTKKNGIDSWNTSWPGSELSSPFGFASREAAEKSLEQHSAEWKTFLRVKE